MDEPVREWAGNTPYTIEVPLDYPSPTQSDTNPTTEEGIALGRRLFYDPILSRDSSQACASCHLQEKAFSEDLAVSIGVEGEMGTRNAMNLFNLAYMNRLTWDGLAGSLEDQAREPVPNPLEQNIPWPEALVRLNAHPVYPEMFWDAFGSEEANIDLSTKAIAQFLRTIVSFTSKYDLAIIPGNGVNLSELEIDGLTLFNNENGIPGEAECIHCHGGILFTDNMFHNNGLDDASDPNDFDDIGLGGITNVLAEYGMFKTPTLRNIELTAPYMHDGRFATLEEVIDHYSSGIKNSPSLDPLIGSPFTNGVNINFTDDEKAGLIAFLKTLTDTVMINNEAYSSPFD